VKDLSISLRLCAFARKSSAAADRPNPQHCGRWRLQGDGFRSGRSWK
jgi:hypothetical protein